MVETLREKRAVNEEEGHVMFFKGQDAGMTSLFTVRRRSEGFS